MRNSMNSMTFLLIIFYGACLMRCVAAYIGNIPAAGRVILSAIEKAFYSYLILC